ncbi:MAG TPA: 2-hydroxychromene-2-carboxylate isomerase, partial [Porticoccus sp.]|nr:2-hydroxychromene-2-carboxylate isomerase [Porticoccus sp.]
YWGVDRLYHLENRLSELSADKQPNTPQLAPRPDTVHGPLKDNRSLTLEFFPTLRSPYTAIIFDRVVEMAEQTGVKLVLRPVLPMVMRGVPTTKPKGHYIYWDAGREARAANVPYGKLYDPIGEPVRNCYSLFSWANEQGKGAALFSAFFKCAFTQAINTNNKRGMRKVIELAGLDWQEASLRMGDPAWEEILENNRLALYNSGIWGTPSFRLLDKHGKEIFAHWGQDRLWLVARQIQDQLASLQ